MPRQIKFVRKFPKGHINEGEPTCFVEKVLNSLNVDFRSKSYYFKLLEINPNKGKYSDFFSEEQIKDFFESLNPSITDTKIHTIRSTDAFKQGDKFTPAVWSGIPYKEPAIKIWHDMEVVKVQPITIVKKDNHIFIGEIDNLMGFYPESYSDFLPKISKNDGLTPEEFESWFSKPFHGNIIGWKNFNY